VGCISGETLRKEILRRGMGGESEIPKLKECSSRSSLQDEFMVNVHLFTAGMA
jgi:hypothetical protein